MPAQRLTMRRVRELLRLHYGIGASARAIARELGVSRSAAQDYLARATAAGLTWPLADEITNGCSRSGCSRRAAPSPGRAGGPSRTGRAGARDEAARRQSDGAVGGVRRRASRRLQLQPLLRTLP
jgi:hypothetical protein